MIHDKSGKRRAVYTALKPFLSETVLLKALDHWDAYYGDNPQLTLQQYIAQIAKGAGLQHQRSSMLLNLSKAMNAPVSTLLPEPTLNAEQRERLPSASVAGAFTAVMNAIMLHLPPASQRGVFFDVLQSLNENHLPPDFHTAMHNWIVKEQPLNLKPQTPKLLRSVLNRTYIVLCERLGPVDADRVLGRAVDYTSRQQPQLQSFLAELL
jgi:hypothetical protein